MNSLIAPENDYRSLLPPPPRAEVDVSVVIPVYNRVSLLARTVAALVAQDHPSDRLQVVVADDGSDEDVKGALVDLEDRLDLTVVRREHEGYGAGQARNLGASVATGDVLVFVDADCVPHPSLVSRHARWHTTADNLVVIGSRHPLDTSRLTIEALADGAASLTASAPGASPGEELLPSDWRRLLYRRTARLRRGDEAFRSLVSSNFSVRRDTFHAVGGFDPSFTRWGGEDTELGWRLFTDGCFFVPDDEASVFHQVQEDAGEEGWRNRARHQNDGIIRTKIPHRFYRKDRALFLHEVPKVSVVVGPVNGDRAYEVFADLRRQSLTDWSSTFIGSGAALVAFNEEAASDPRVRVRLVDETDATRSRRAVEAALDEATGEYLAVVDGAVSLDHRLLGRAIRRLDQRPRATSLSVGYRLPGAGRTAVAQREDDAAALDRAWRDDDLPLFGVLRAREWRKHRRAADSGAGSPWTSHMVVAGREHLPQPLVGVPSPERSEDVAAPAFRSARSILLEELRGRRDPRSVAAATARFVRERRGQARPEAGPAVVKARPAASAGGDPESRDGRVSLRYVGWTGHENLGDEVLLDAITTLMPWADIRTQGAPRELLMLGGGTLINRGYLAQLDRMDSPRIERVVFGTGVANPEYWGKPREAPEAWVEFLSTCGYVGVRGPISERILRGWGYRGELEVVGDPALAIEPPSTQPIDDRVVVNLARTRGELWGGSDDVVVDAMASLVRHLVAEGRDVHLLSCFPGDDGLGLEVMRRAGAPDLPYVFGYRSTAEALDLLGASSLVIGERLHSLVLAAACRVPFVGLEYRPKVRDFAASLGLEHLVTRTSDLTADTILGIVKIIEADRAAVVDQLAERRAIYRGRLQRAAGEVKSLLPS